MKATEMHRLARLEARRDAGSAVSAICPTCGHDPAAPFRFTIDPTPVPVEHAMSAEYCPRCGTMRWFTIKIDRREREDGDEAG